MNRAVALICDICHPVFSVPNPHAEFVSTFTDKKLSPHGSAWPFAGRLSSCVKVFAFASFAFHNDLHPFIICHRHQCFVRSLYLCEFNFAVIFDFLLRQIIRCIFLMVYDDTAIKGIFENMRNDHLSSPAEVFRPLRSSSSLICISPIPSRYIAYIIFTVLACSGSTVHSTSFLLSSTILATRL